MYIDIMQLIIFKYKVLNNIHIWCFPHDVFKPQGRSFASLGKELSLLIPAQDPAPFEAFLECLHRARGHNTGLWEDPHFLKQQVEVSCLI